MSSRHADISTTSTCRYKSSFEGRLGDFARIQENESTLPDASATQQSLHQNLKMPLSIRMPLRVAVSARENHDGCVCEGFFEFQVHYLAGTGNAQLGPPRPVAGHTRAGVASARSA